jgi:predicted phosphate transport protein (TIGR00153 family)
MLFKKTKSLEDKFNKFLNLTNDAVLILNEGIKCYLEKDKENFDHYLNKLIEHEGKADSIRKDIEIELYQKTLIPESRGDIFDLLENLDDIINQAKETLMEFSIEIPSIPQKYNDDFSKLTEYSINAVNQVVKASRRFIQDPSNVEHNIHKVYHWEKEADRQSEQLKRKVFRDNSIVKLSMKIHLRYFALHIDMVADKAEDVADRLSIYAIKRSI